MEGPRDPLADSALSALDRLLEGATAEDSRARADAVEALATRTIHVATIPGTAPPEPRVLVNSKGEVGLPVYTRLQFLEEGARLYGWLAPDGRLDSMEMGSRQAFQLARERAMHAVIVDCGLAVSIEVFPHEWPQAPVVRRPSQPGFGRQSSTGMSAVQAGRSPSSHPPPHAASSSPGAISAPVIQQAASDEKRTSSSGTVAAVGGPAAASPPDPLAQSSTLRSPTAQTLKGMPPTSPATTVRGIAVGTTMDVVIDGASCTLSRLLVTPADKTFDELSNALRDFPEVEWASFVTIAREGSDGVLGAGVRVDQALKKRIPEITAALVKAADAAGVPGGLPVASLEQPQVMRFVRQLGVPFYPWRK